MMLISHIRQVAIASAIGVLGLGSLAPSAPVSTSGTPRVIQIIADKDNTFKVPGESKPVITLQRGETVTLRITSHFGGEKSRDNYVHSFVVKKLRDEGWDLRLKEGTEDFTVTAPKAPGEYLAECTVKCGRGHDDMNMKVVVR
jgi:heme/copper-type cytochrome/quinol oxidase subunit 2